MSLKLNPKQLMKYLDEALLLDAFKELLSRENAETILYMQNGIMGTIAFDDKPVLRKLVK